MNQTTFWHETELDALTAAVNAAGGHKRVATKLWPALDATSAAARMRGCCNSDHAQKADLEEVSMIIGLAKEAGDHSIMEFLARKHGYEIKPLSTEDSKKQAIRARRLALLAELHRLEDEE